MEVKSDTELEIAHVLFIDTVGYSKLLLTEQRRVLETLSTIVRGHLDILGSLANPRGISARGLELIARGAVDVKPLVTHCFSLAEFDQAWATFVERRDGAIRVMVHP